MRKVQMTIYNFDELPEDVQNTLIENCDLTHLFEEDAQLYLDNKAEELEEIFRDINISYSGFWSQGDGASFTCKFVNILNLITEEAIRRGIKHGKLLTDNAIHSIIDDLEVNICRVNFRYVHCNSIYVNSDYYGNRYRIGNAMAEFIKQTVKKEHDRIANDIYKHLETLWDNTNEKENIKEFLNYFEYYEDGSTFYDISQN